MNLEKDAHKYLVDKGCLSMGQKYTAIEVQKMLVDFAEEQVKLYSQTPVSVSVCDFIGCKNEATNVLITRNEYYCDKHS
jgi:hypothetical protein